MLCWLCCTAGCGRVSCPASSAFHSIADTHNRLGERKQHGFRVRVAKDFKRRWNGSKLLPRPKIPRKRPLSAISGAKAGSSSAL